MTAGIIPRKVVSLLSNPYTDVVALFFKTRQGKILAVGVTLLLILVLYVAYVFWQLGQIFPDDIKFDRVLWQTSSTDGLDTSRCLMQRDLERHHLQVGMAKTEVTELLGGTSSDDQNLTYYLGFCGFSMDGVSLRLEFTNNKLIRVSSVQH